MSFSDDAATLTFAELGFSGPLLQAINDAGYESPTPIQREMIPHVLAGRDVVGQAQTGTGKTAAFALPLLTRLRAENPRVPQILVLAPTRELAIQVAESFETYGKHLKNLRILPIFGGQDYNVQLKQLHYGVQVIVGTPGRVMDHIRRGSLNPQTIHSLVLDEADEMLKMGFLDDVQWILDQLPGRRQTALFSATMPQTIREIAHTYLTDPVEITIKTKTVSAQTVNQRYLLTGGMAGKMTALPRILEAEDFDGMLVFVRTKLQTVEIAEHLAALGHSVAALNGDIQQSQRLRTIEQLKAKKIDILVATDVAARGLDVERISHVINFDVPFDAEAYIHRIGRTGRAGRSGEAILFINGRERSMLRTIEQATRQKIALMELPTAADINRRRIAAFKARITETLAGDTAFHQKLVGEYLAEHEVAPEQLAAALSLLAQGNRPLLLPEEKREPVPSAERRPAAKKASNRQPRPIQVPPEEGMERFLMELGSEHGIKPGNIVGAIANEADLNSRHIGRIAIFDTYSTVDLPYGMPDEILRVLHRSRVGNRMLKLQRMAEAGDGDGDPAREPRRGNARPGRKPGRHGGDAAGKPNGKGRKKAQYKPAA